MDFARSLASWFSLPRPFNGNILPSRQQSGNEQSICCLIKDRPFSEVINVQIPDSHYISDLKLLVKEGASSSSLQGVNTDDLVIYNVSIANRDNTSLDKLYQRINKGDVSVSIADSMATIGSVFPRRDPGHVHVVVGFPDKPASSFEPVHKELWGKAAGFSGIQNFTIEVPQPQFYLEPGYRSRMEQAGIRDFPLLHTTHKTKAGVFKKLKTTNKLPCGRSLLIRSEYESIENTLVEAVSSKWAGVNPGEDPKKGEHLDYKVSGQPGSGKTWFLSYILARRLLDGQPTVYRRSDGKCYLFSEWSKGREVNLEFLSTLSDNEKRELWILSDEALVDPEWNSDHPWFVVLAVSPQKVKASRQWEKDRNCGAHYMNSWGWDEIFAAFSLKNPKVGLAEINLLYTAFTCFGPVPRTCLDVEWCYPSVGYLEYCYLFVG